MTAPSPADDGFADMPLSSDALNDLQRLERLIHLQGRLLDLTATLGSTTDLEAILRRATDGALAILDAERATVWIHEPTTGELVTRIGHGLAEPMRIRADAGIAGEVFSSGGVINITDAVRDPRVMQPPDYRVRNMLALPLINFDGSAVGVLQILNKRQGPFNRDDERLGRVLGAQVGVALQRSLLLAEYRRKLKMESDLRIARDIQRSLLPRRMPTIEGYLLFGWNRPADETGGDAFDVFVLPDGRVSMVVCDATGHGVGPALMVSECRALLRASAQSEPHPAAVLQRANGLLNEDAPDGRFVTAFFGNLLPAEHRVRWASAGQGPILHMTAAGDWHEFNATACPLGILSELAIDPPVELPMQPGDWLVVMTDGLLEWADEAGEAFGLPRAMAVLAEHRTAPLEDACEALVAAVEDHVGGRAQDDDLTVIFLRRSAD